MKRKELKDEEIGGKKKETKSNKNIRGGQIEMKRK